MIELTLQRFHHGDEDSLGLLFLGEKFYAFVPEDAPRAVKIPGRTRIPAGRYRVLLVDAPDKFKTQHGPKMFLLENVLDFQGIFIHILNRASESRGCLGPNYQVLFGPDGESICGYSTVAYKRLRDAILPRMEAGEPCYLTIRDESFLFPAQEIPHAILPPIVAPI